MSDVDNKVKMIVEGLLMAAGRPLSLDNIIAVFSEEEKPDRKELKAVMEAIKADCDDRGFELMEVASGFRFQVKQDLSEWVAKLWEEKPPRYTRALLETLALIAYRQPITRGDIEEIRGVAVSPNIIRTLLDREWVRVVGHRDVPGRPAMFATTRQFLDYFNLKSLQELPPLSEIKELDKQDDKMDLDDDLASQRVIDLPEEPVDENSVELSDEERAELLAEEEAIELAKKPLDEILSQDPARQEEKLDELLSEAGDEADNGSGQDRQQAADDAQTLAREQVTETTETEENTGADDDRAKKPETETGESVNEAPAADAQDQEIEFTAGDDDEEFGKVDADTSDSDDFATQSQQDEESGPGFDDDELEPFSRSGSE